MASQAFGNGVAFTDTRADTGDQGETGADGAAGEDDTNSKFESWKGNLLKSLRRFLCKAKLNPAQAAAFFFRRAEASAPVAM